MSFSYEERAVTGQLYLSEILSALSFALDLSEDAIPGHALRTTVLGMRIGRELGLDEGTLRSLYYALLLKDAGCSNSAARMCHIVLGDDRTMKSQSKMIDWTAPRGSSLAMLGLLWRQVLPDGGLIARLNHIAHMAFAKQDFSREVILLRCERGAEIVRKIGVGDEAAEAVRLMDEHWDGKGYPSKLAGTEIPVLARILAVAQYLDIFASVCDVGTAMSVLEERGGRWFDPELVRIAFSLHREGALWQGCMVNDHCVRQTVLAMEPGHLLPLTERQLDVVCSAFSDVVDAKSPYTHSHSVGVATVAKGMAIAMSLPADRVRTLHRAGLLHDIGKLRVPNTILDRAGPLTDAEFKIIQEHPGLSREILARVDPFREIAEIAGDHHERLDGSGYPKGLPASRISFESRILQVADVFGALSEARPYRCELSPQEMMRMIEKQVPDRLDPICHEALLHWMDTDPIAAEFMVPVTAHVSQTTSDDSATTMRLRPSALAR